MTNIPPQIRSKAVIEIVRQFDHLHWEELSNRERTLHYDRFIRDPKIGGILRPFLSDANIRVWIKDGLAKEYRRALEGRGPLAGITGRAYPGPQAVVTKALDIAWTPREGSIDEKPMRCYADDDKGQSMFVIWGDYGSLRDLVWHATLVRASDSLLPITIAITKPGNANLDPDSWKQVEAH